MLIGSVLVRGRDLLAVTALLEPRGRKEREPAGVVEGNDVGKMAERLVFHADVQQL